MSLLPVSRIGKKGWPPLKRAPVDPAEWENLKKGSKKGFVLLLVGLSWWATQATTKKDRDMVSTALKDVLFVVRQLATKAAAESDTSVLRKRSRVSKLASKRYLQIDILLLISLT